jgi:hypothetical protein
MSTMSGRVRDRERKKESFSDDRFSCSRSRHIVLLRKNAVVTGTLVDSEELRHFIESESKTFVLRSTWSQARKTGFFSSQGSKKETLF